MRRPFSLRHAFLLGILIGLIVAAYRARNRATPSSLPAPLDPPKAALPEVTVDAFTTSTGSTARQSIEPEAPTVDRDSAVAATPIEAVPSQDRSWAEPVDGGCPDGYPIKVKQASGILHQPGGLSYERTNPDRCYRSVAAAEADGFRVARR